MTRRRAPEGRSAKEARHVRIYHWMQDTEAWQNLNGNERAIYIDIARRYRGPGTNNGRIPYAVRDATKALPIGLATAQRCLKRLTELGFIVCTMKGAFKASHDASTWRLTEMSCDVTGELASKDFARWRASQKQIAVSEAERDGSCVGTVLYLSRNGPHSKPG